MIDPSLPVQDAVISALRAHAGLTAIVEQKIWDKVPTNREADHPYVSLGAEQMEPDQNPCGDQYEVWLNIDHWSRKPGRVEAKQMVAATLDALTAPLTVAGFRVVVQRIDPVQYRPQPDGLTTLGLVPVYWSLVPLP